MLKDSVDDDAVAAERPADRTADPNDARSDVPTAERLLRITHARQSAPPETWAAAIRKCRDACVYRNRHQWSMSLAIMVLSGFLRRRQLALVVLAARATSPAMIWRRAGVLTGQNRSSTEGSAPIRCSAAGS